MTRARLLLLPLVAFASVATVADAREPAPGLVTRIEAGGAAVDHLTWLGPGRLAWPQGRCLFERGRWRTARPLTLASAPIAVLSDGRSVASGARAIEVRDEDGVLLRTIPAVTERWLTALAFSPRSEGPLAAGGVDGKLRLIEPGTGKLVAPPIDHQNAIELVAFSTDGGRLATSSQHGIVRLIDPATGAILRTFDLHGPVSGLAFAGGVLVAARTDGLLRIRSLEGDARLVLRPGSGERRVLAASADGRRLATACGSSVEVLDARTWGIVARHASDPVRVTSLAFSPDGAHLAVGGADGSVLIFRADG